MTGDQPNSEPFVSTISPVSSPGFGGGPSDDDPSATPAVTVIPTPPVPPYPEVAHVPGASSKVVVCCETQTLSYCVESFSSKTCVELLNSNSLTPDQIQFEANYFRTLNHERELRHKNNLSDLMVNHIANHLKTEMSESMCTDFDAIIKNCDLTLNNFSYLTEKAQLEVDKLVTMNAESRSPVTAKDPDVAESMTSAERPLTDSVWFLSSSIDFSELSVDDILRQFPVNTRSTQGRYVTYFGNKPYEYGHIRHDPRDYPDCNVFDTIRTKMKSVDPDFNFDNFTCVVTYYPDGKACIPPHSDNERFIKPDSNIYTISVGAPRTLRLVNRDGVLWEHDKVLPHGTLTTMSAESQNHWSHELLYDPSINEPRISFTFRCLIDSVPKVPAPLIEKPPPVLPRMAMGSKHRILFLTDSVLNSTPEYIFNRVENHRCVRKKNYYLTDIFNYEPEFCYSKFVILSGGVNDMSTNYNGRPPMTSHTLADYMGNRLRLCCDKNYDTTFVFNSVLHTKHEWLNDEIDTFNKFIFELSCTIPNLRFFDSHHALMRNIISENVDNVIDRKDGRGAHLTLAAKKLIGTQLVNAIELLDGRQSGSITESRIRGWTWPYRSSFVATFRSIASSHSARSIR